MLLGPYRLFSSNFSQFYGAQRLLRALERISYCDPYAITIKLRIRSITGTTESIDFDQRHVRFQMRAAVETYRRFQ